MKKLQEKYRDLPGEDMVRIICRAADGQRALDVVALDVRGLASFADYFVIMGGTSTRHVQGLAETLDREVASKRMKSAETEGLGEGQWILLDYNDVIVHIFHHEVRSHYDLEGLWHDAPRLDLSQPPPVVAEVAVKKPKKRAEKAAKATSPGPGRKKTSRPETKPVKSARGSSGPSSAKSAGKASGRSSARAAGRPGSPATRRSGSGGKK